MRWGIAISMNWLPIPHHVVRTGYLRMLAMRMTAGYAKATERADTVDVGRTSEADECG